MSSAKRTIERNTNTIDITPHKPNLILKAKVTAKTALKSLLIIGKDSQMFSCQLLDNTSEIRMTFFAEEIGEVYEIRYYKVKSALKHYNDLNHPYELNAVKNTSFDIDDATLPKSMKLSLKFETLQNISQLQEDCCRDVFAIVKSFEDQKGTYSSIKNITHTKRDIELIDQTETMITLTLWGDHSSQLKSNVGDVIALEIAKVTIYQGIVKLSSTNSSIVMYDHQGKDRKNLETYWANNNK
ncbi:hypothetical protein QAD02_013338 [Eretmocerus hayati]|uniref:Uncharacterized protein n=1 Tax=Eretmocerus hayati TaxID=131215 RepID=A0ACC2P3A6_9HYME|nr:hypothetical protein QAD02_013338 [Eretmocerus hayati]